LRASEDSLYGLHTLVSAARKDLRIPLIAAGGLADLSSLRAVAVLGADAFQLGSAFLACKESGASEFHRKALLDRNQTPTLLTRAYTGRLARFIENEFTEMSRKRALPVLPYPAQNYLLAELKKVSALAGRTDLSPLYAGQGATHLLHDSAHALMQSLTHEPIHPTPERKTP
jgi:nitronate monooxygenase